MHEVIQAHLGDTSFKCEQLYIELTLYAYQILNQSIILFGVTCTEFLWFLLFVDVLNKKIFLKLQSDW